MYTHTLLIIRSCVTQAKREKEKATKLTPVDTSYNIYHLADVFGLFPYQEKSICNSVELPVV